ncbi:uncharacterized protein APUU_50116S [Aspergillus puulaauensis]|uniref:Zn(2)-C6 fungal-type domain-containing protein n=1 Tax=Aspergillus puulaauensis TaxID=1220207 RepID=A0A7R8AQ91_9EURO|nr:uncharacterized protein APUU_50116S [Aspergillus puulaauensis]BCS25405.1 hypothetical protein APUU_50116S [Aspergillus puulaauensis]
MPDPHSRPAKGASRRLRTGSRTTVACVSCKERKLRCDDQAPACTNCQRNKLACLVEDPATKRLQPRNYTALLEHRVKLLESAVRQLQPGVAQSRARAAEGDGHEVSDLCSIMGVLSLNAAGAEPRFLGSSSAFAFTRFISPSIRQLIPSIAPDLTGNRDQTVAPEPCLLPEYSTAVRLSNAYFQNIHPQYPFLDEATFRIWEAALKDPVTAMSIYYKPGPLFFLNMVYAIGALLLPSPGCSPEQLYASALLYIDDILCHDNIESIQVLLCCAAYSLRSSQGTSHWKLAGQALRQCVNLGYHRSSKHLLTNISPKEQELQKQVFWSAYQMECAAAVMLGRPLSLRFEDIDAEFPKEDGDPECEPKSPPTSTVKQPTMMTYANHAFRIRSLQGCTQTQVYSDTTLQDPKIRQSRINKLSTMLDDWKSSLPPPRSPPDTGALSFFTTPDWYQAAYNHAILHLHRVQLTNKKEPASDAVVMKCLHAAKEVCHSFRRQFVGGPTTYTWSALHELFIAGLTYLYCLWTSAVARTASRLDQVSNTCTDCTMVLVVFAERWRDAAPYRDIFQALASRTITMIADSPNYSSDGIISVTEDDPGDVSQWMVDIADTGVSLGAGQLLSEFVDGLSPR